MTTAPVTTQTQTTSETSESSEASEDDEISKGEARSFIEDYFSLVTSDRDAAWDLLAPERQDDRAGYDEFWSGIESVETSRISVSDDGRAVSVTLTYRPKDRDVSVEQHTYALTRIDGSIRMTK